MYDLSTGPVFSFMLTTYFFVSLETVLPGPNFLKHVYVGSSYTYWDIIQAKFEKNDIC